MAMNIISVINNKANTNYIGKVEIILSGYSPTFQHMLRKFQFEFNHKTKTYYKFYVTKEYTEDVIQDELKSICDTIPKPYCFRKMDCTEMTTVR